MLYKYYSGREQRFPMWLQLLAFMVPCYAANAAPVLLGGGARMDMGIKLSDGKPLFGKTKSVRGFAGGILAGVLASIILSNLWPTLIFNNPQTLLLSGIMLSVGALVGDLAGSFLKRRLSIGEGKQFNVVDQMDFVVGGLVFAYPFAAPILTLPNLAFILIVSYALHVATNILANRAGLKKVPW
jgi:CDP-2,3-bis-(O-geranylgeranyl)-sn-glycerol synthase